MRGRRQFDADGGAGTHLPAARGRAHDAGEPHDGARVVGIGDLFERPGLEVVDLQAGFRSPVTAMTAKSIDSRAPTGRASMSVPRVVALP